MKRILLLVLILLMCLQLTACGSSKVEEVERRIAAIGTVTLEREAAIISAEAAYDVLPDRLKTKVVNYDDLVNARVKYNTLQAEYKAEQERLERLKPMQEFAEKLFLDYASRFTDALTIEMIDAWVYCEDEYKTEYSGYSFTFHFEIDTNWGTRKKVYYGASSVRLNAEDSYKYYLGMYFLSGRSSDYWSEGEVTAMQKGEKLDADAIWDYFLQHYEG